MGGRKKVHGGVTLVASPEMTDEKRRVDCTYKLGMGGGDVEELNVWLG